MRRLTVNPSTRLIVPAWVGAVPHPVSSEDGWGRQGDVKDLSLADRMEVTKKYAKAHQTASKKDKTRILDQVVALTGRNLGHVCQQLRRRDGQPPGTGRRDDRGRRSMPILVSIPATPDSCWDGVGRHGCQRPVPVSSHQPAAPAGTAVDQPAHKPVAARKGANPPRPTARRYPAWAEQIPADDRRGPRGPAPVWDQQPAAASRARDRATWCESTPKPRRS